MRYVDWLLAELILLMMINKPARNM